MDSFDRTEVFRAQPTGLDSALAALREAVAPLVPDPDDCRAVRVRWRRDTGELLVQLRVKDASGRMVHRWRRWAPHESGRSAERAMHLAAAALRSSGGEWPGWSTGAPPYLPFLCELRRPS